MQGYDDIVMLRDIEVESHCEHHMAPFLGKAFVAYMPTNKVVGISKLARVVEIFSRRLQTQETLTQQIADAITDNLKPAGVAVLIDAKHECMTTRGVHHRHVSTITTQFTGVFKTDRAAAGPLHQLLQPGLKLQIGRDRLPIEAGPGPFSLWGRRWPRRGRMRGLSEPSG